MKKIAAFGVKFSNSETAFFNQSKDFLLQVTSSSHCHSLSLFSFHSNLIWLLFSSFDRNVGQSYASYKKAWVVAIQATVLKVWIQLITSLVSYFPFLLYLKVWHSLEKGYLLEADRATGSTYPCAFMSRVISIFYLSVCHITRRQTNSLAPFALYPTISTNT